MHDEFRMRVRNRQYTNGVAVAVADLGLRGGRRLDQQAVPEHGLPLAVARREMQEVLGLQHRIAIAVGRTVADLEDHRSVLERALTQRAPFSTRLK